MKALGLALVFVFGCGPRDSDPGRGPVTISASATSTVPAVASDAPAIPTARKNLGPEINARMELTTRCPDCPSYVVTVDRSGAIAFTGERRVRMSHANAQLSNDQAKALFAYVVPDVFVDRETRGEPSKKRVELRFEDGTGSTTLSGESPCAAPTGRYDRHAAPSPRCELENALRDAARPFVYCGPKGCPDKPDPNAKAADFGDVTLACKPACNRVLLDGKPVRTPATIRLAPGLHALELQRRGRPTHQTTVRVEAGQHTSVSVDMSKTSLELEIERGLREGVEQLFRPR